MAISRIDYVSDAEHRIQPSDFLEAPSSAASDWQTSSPWFDDAGWVLPLGGFLIRTEGRTILIDAGIGPNIDILDHSGQLLTSLGQLGTAADEVTDIILTHLHVDHVGWIAPAGEPVFSHARHYCHRADFDRLGSDTGSSPAMTGVHDAVKAVSDLLNVADGDQTEITSSISLRLFPGHTPGNCIVDVDTAEGPVLLLGDTAHHPVLLVEDGWTDRLDENPAEAARARVRVAEEMERTNAVGLGAHFPGVRGGRITRDASGKRQWRPTA
ncbi:MBL fold metallo-hydrolase [Mycobacterium sp. GA-2829]|uniref:MBL fold metallo-hydrolase n=1 Tax=Mycobacterium sp. GA-2829 TaxID=1772283 RepID=UPI0007400767|nr:MBL fold metallo-hydrolase [Mycobacterium sp. GA-2829]KUI29286.1 hypothetical protein AU194_20655 [Mycobacterium sp. GA-2829]